MRKPVYAITTLKRIVILAVQTEVLFGHCDKVYRLSIRRRKASGYLFKKVKNISCIVRYANLF